MDKRNIIIALLLGILLAGGGIWLYSSNFLDKTRESADTKSQIPDYKAKSVEVGTALKTGIYKLEGYSSSLQSNPNYNGEVEITKTGEVYKVAWYIGGQRQDGVGILENNILSVGYIEIIPGDIRDMGVVSYRVVNPGKLEGKWSSVLGSETGREVLTWQSSF